MSKYCRNNVMFYVLVGFESTDERDIEDFLYGDTLTASPFEIKDMDKAVSRIRKASVSVEYRDKILMYSINTNSFVSLV